MSEDRPYPNTGKLYAALEDFKLGYCAGMTKSWPRYWKEFADQAFADLIAMEVEKSELNAQLAEARELAEYSREHGERNLTGHNEQYLLAEKARAFLTKYFPKESV